MAQSSVHNRWIACCSCLGAAGLIVGLSLFPLLLTSRQRLTRIGRRVASSYPWNQSYDGYHWESNDTQIVSMAGLLGTPMRLDDRTGLATPIMPPPGLNGVGASYNQGPRPSPDGRWLLFRPQGSGYFTALDTTTQKTVRWKAARNSSSYILWFPDSHRWAEFGRAGKSNSTQPVVHSIDGPDRKTAPVADFFSWPCGVAPSTHVLDAHNSDHLDLWEYDLDADAPKAVQHRVPFPPGTYVSEVEGSPDGRRVAYIVEERTAPFLNRLFGSLFPVSISVSIWVSRTDGSELHRIGFEPTRIASGLQWSPDEKRLSLFMKDGFYIVPVN